ncbi:DUF6218 family protein [Corynebacterium choanae]|uniref:Uncharacterized protein n=1 Tax=Corynebacterium choanae TaxID=1862358 RepID=A0A3G6JA36_9CORY|nr:DUF6218 family protein [Corynebacterium choanae]AZA14643.1 hypothetical protein CCHOA_11360 [Corynebacterium choanae]
MAADDQVSETPLLLQGPAASSYPVISVIDQNSDDPTAPVVVWHVHTGPQTITGRLNGAWVIGQSQTQQPESHPVEQVTDPAQSAAENDPAADVSGADSEVTAQLLAATADHRSDEEKLESLLRHTAVIVTDRTNVHTPQLAAALATATTIGGIADVYAAANAGVAELNEAIRAESSRRKTLRREEKATTGKMTTPLLKTFAFDPIAPIDNAPFATSFRGEPLAANCFVATMEVAAIVDAWLAVESARRRRSYLRDSFGEHPRPLPLGEQTPGVQQ